MSTIRKYLIQYLPMLCFLSVLPIWQLCAQVFNIPNYILPSPLDIYQAFQGVEMTRWLEHIGATLKVAILGFLIAMAISLPLAICMVRFQMLKRILLPILVVIQSTPVVAVAPLIIVILGTDDAPRLAITCLITFFPLVVSATTGLMETPTSLIELGQSLSHSRLKEFWYIRLPYAVPHIFSGMKVAITLAIIGAVVAEFVAAEQGLGYFVQFSTSYFNIPQAFAALFILSALSLALFKCVNAIQYLFFRWSYKK